MLGPERPLLLSRADKERIAYHEGGHAILGLVVPGADPVNRVTIVPRGQALGVTYQRPDSDRTTIRKPIYARGSSECWEAARPRRLSMAPRRPAPKAISSKPPAWPARW